ncbi:hypothetical protein AGMMS49982_24120 [Bacteroidia bacterium]|nr:hypothetical protein AGMMS49982_24120 [Bacteroidia bacterium]
MFFDTTDITVIAKTIDSGKMNGLIDAPHTNNNEEISSANAGIASSPTPTVKGIFE